MRGRDVVKKFANILEVSADILIYGTEDEKAKSKITDTELLNMFSKGYAKATGRVIKKPDHKIRLSSILFLLGFPYSLHNHLSR